MKRSGWVRALLTLSLLAILGVLAQASCGRIPPAPPPGRAFAERLEDLPGLGNLGRMAPGIYRGAQPTEEGLDRLKAMGIRSVVNLRHDFWEQEAPACRERGLEYLHLPLDSSGTPSDADVRRFLAWVTDPARQPVFVHCHHGCDRTGTLCACYRIAVDRWPLDDALREMDAFGFKRIWRDLRAYVGAFPDRRAEVWPDPPGRP